MLEGRVQWLSTTARCSDELEEVLRLRRHQELHVGHPRPVNSLGTEVNTLRLRLKTSKRSFLVSLALLLWLLIFSSSIKAQTAEFTQGSKNTNVVSLEVPLASYPGRGINLPITLRYSSSGLWRVGLVNSVTVGGRQRAVTEAIYAEHSTAGWTTSLNLPQVEWPRQNDVYWYTGKPYAWGSHYPYTFRIANVFIHMPDGSTHELRKADAVYQDMGQIDQADMTGTFYAIDGSRIRYDSTGANTGILYLPDGARYVLGGVPCQAPYSHCFIDANGNTLNYDVASRQWKDTMGRVIGMPWPANPSPGEDYRYYLPGMAAPYIFKFASFSGPTVADYYLSGSIPTNEGVTGPTLFHSILSDPNDPDADFSNDAYMISRQYGYGPLNAVVLTEIDLPNGQRYQFSYNSYGELEKVTYPTGGYQRYEYNTVATIGGSQSTYGQGSRGIISRWVSPNGSGGADEALWQYSASVNPKRITAPDGSYTETYIFNAPVVQSNNFGYAEARNGQVYDERVFAPDGTMLRRSLTDYNQSSSITSKPVPPGTINSGTYTAYRSARPTKSVSLIFDKAGHALAKTMTYEYAANGCEFTTGLNLTASTESYFDPVNGANPQTGTISEIQPGTGTVASRAETTYLDDPAYLSLNILGLPTSIILKDHNDHPVSKSESFYDESSLEPYNDFGNDWTNPGSYRGNLTTARRYLDPSATVPQNAECPVGVCFATHAFFDQVGNAWKTQNERGVETTTEFPANYKHAFATKVTSAVPDPSGTHGSNTAFESSSTFDETRGLVLTTTDVNGQVTVFSYQDDGGVQDPLNRLRKVTRPDGGWTRYSFGEAPNDPLNQFTKVETRQDSTRTVISYQYVDPLGRPSRSFVSEGGGSYIATDTLYDSMGRVWQVSNPYRTGTLNGLAARSHTDDWTESYYDALSRIDYVRLPDSSIVDTDYDGIYTTVTDQAGRQRRQKTDALGRIVRVDEMNVSWSLGTVDNPTQPSFYEYNTQGNLIAISQGLSQANADPENPANYLQHRYFKYDSLGRLLFEKQAEQVATINDPGTGTPTWSRKLAYDETIVGVSYVGLLTTATDARNITTQFRYDNLNRIYQVSYSDETPEVDNYYDQEVNGYFNKGHLTQASTVAVGSIPATTQSYNYDLMGRVANNQQTVGDHSYGMSYGYNLGGVMKSETYPSGRVVNYAFDDGARLSQVSSGSTVFANQFDYSTTEGLLKSVTLGNGAVETYDYNSRLQLKSIDLSRGGIQIQHYDYKYGVYDPNTNAVNESKNTGQIARIEGFISAAKQWQQNFEYDSLGRLKSAREARGDTGAPSWLVNYDYDVFGNRYQYQSQNGSNPFSPVWVEPGQISPGTNRFISGVTYDDAGNLRDDSKFRSLSFHYDANNRQKQSSDGTNTFVSVYDAGGQRVATQVNNALTNVLVYDAGGKLVAEYGAAVVTGGTQYVFSDHQGSPRAITGPSGNVISRQDYAPFGEEIGRIGMRSSTPGYGAGDKARQKYAGMEDDDGAGLSHTLWRQYDNRSGRWTAPDPYDGSMSAVSPQSFNRYAYVSNDSVNNIDPTGLMLSDIGVYQINDPEEAATTQRHFDALSQKDINGQYAAARGGTVIYDKDTGKATFIGKYSAVNYFRRLLNPSVTVSATITNSDGESASEDDPQSGGGATRPWDRANFFSELWSNHPGIKDSKACQCPNPDGKTCLTEGDNCAARLSVALQNLGVDMSSFGVKGTCKTAQGQRVAMGALPLANWLASSQRLGTPEKFTDGQSALINIWNRTGIIYIRQFIGFDPPFKRWDHIDLWDGYRMATGKTGWITNSPREVRFWPIPR